ncbi:MAG TPA: DUF2764 family protein [Candidatus Brocadiaceae bacterium]|nr:DUF2764 family protein [Candidatus Brocadiaceae bacterium]
MAYYYLVSSLIPLTLEDAPPYTPEDFLSSCRDMLARKDAIALEHVYHGRLDEVNHPFIKEWKKLEYRLKNALARARTARMKLPPEPYLRNVAVVDAATENAVTEAMNKPNPLEKELALDRYRWKILEELTPIINFDLSAIFSYAIKLKMVIRWNGMTGEKGNGCVTGIMDKQLQGLAL